MSVLSDVTIRHLLEIGHIRIQPLDDRAVQPASVDLRLHDWLRDFPRTFRGDHVDPRRDNTGLTRECVIDEDNPYELEPGQFVLGCTAERVTLPADLVGRLEGKSSLGRLGLLVHATAGFVDPGWDGRLTLELYNALDRPFLLYAGMPIAQLAFMRLTAPAARPYGSDGLGSKYRGDAGPAESRYHLNFARES